MWFVVDRELKVLPAWMISSKLTADFALLILAWKPLPRTVVKSESKKNGFKTRTKGVRVGEGRNKRFRSRRRRSLCRGLADFLTMPALQKEHSPLISMSV
jgi:hypothetical protein